VHQNRRWDDDFLIIKKLVEEQKLGHVFRIESRVHGSRGIPGDWRKEKVHGGGMVLDWGVHLLDQILYMYGDRKIETVYASLTNITNQEVDDGFTAILTFEGGTEVLVEVGTNNHFRYTEKFNKPVIFVVNQLDHEKADFDRAVEQLKENYGGKAAKYAIIKSEDTPMHTVFIKYPARKMTLLISSMQTLPLTTMEEIARQLNF
jgi:predicted dehydrogenase